MELANKLPVCPTALTAAQLEQYHRDGYLAFTDVLAAVEVEQARGGLTQLIRNAQHNPDFVLREGGAFRKLSSPNTSYYLQIESTANGTNLRALPDADFELTVRKLTGFCAVDPIFSGLAQAQPRVRGVLESLIGADPILFGEMALIKPPFIGTEKPWHQDNAYFCYKPLEAVVTAWIALDDATVKNGCMHVLAGEHKLGPRRHHHTFDCEIVPDRRDPSRAVPVEIPAGGAMFFSGMLPHQTPPNQSPDRRRALQFQYRSATSEVVSREEYNRIFAEADGTPATCVAGGSPW
jgi:hypothetical protein